MKNTIVYKKQNTGRYYVYVNGSHVGIIKNDKYRSYNNWFFNPFNYNIGNKYGFKVGAHDTLKAVKKEFESRI